METIMGETAPEEAATEETGAGTDDLASRVVAILRAHEAELREAGIRRLSLFGSVARGDNEADSDVDLAADNGGNCEATVPGEVVRTPNGVTVLGYRNWPARIAVSASQLYSRNLMTFLTTFWDKASGKPVLPEADEIVRGVMLTRGGAVVHAQFQPAQAA